VLATLSRLRRRYALPDPEALARIAQERRECPTRAERALAAFLSEVNGHALEGRFVREWVCGDRWIVDFYFPEVRLAIEVDGGYHRSTFQIGWDLFKAAELEAAGLTLVRLTNQEVLGDRERLIAKLRQAWGAARDLRATLQTKEVVTSGDHLFRETRCAGVPAGAPPARAIAPRPSPSAPATPSRA
jgi:very-short-patch-repair endonuclease